MRFVVRVAGLLALVGLTASPSAAQTLKVGEDLFNSHCKSCHEPAIDRAPNRATLSTMAPADVIEALTNGVMKPMGSSLSASEKQSVAAYLTGLPGKDADQTKYPIGSFGVDVKCSGPTPAIQPTGSDWTSVGVDAQGHRFQPKPGLSPNDVGRLRVKWSFAMTGGGAPTVIGDWLFIANRSGKFYALDSRTGCVRWVVDRVVSRTTPMVVKSAISPSGWLTLIGLRNRTVRAFDARTGKAIWVSPELDANPVATITGAPLIVGDLVMTPMTSGEEGTAGDPAYQCCSFRGSLVALDLRTGQLRWKTNMITEPLKPTRISSAGTQMQGPAGAAIWSAPVYDPKRDLVLVATGDSYTNETSAGDDAIFAIEAKTGKVRWSRKVMEGDNFIGACGGEKSSPNCPTPLGGDFDFGASPVLMRLPSGKDIVLAGQKSGLVYGLDADTGALLWTRRVGAGSALGGVEWGMASDGRRLFVANADTFNLTNELAAKEGRPLRGGMATPPSQPGMTALNPQSGAILWQTPAPVADCHYAGRKPGEGCIRAQSQAPAAMPGVVFAGTMDGWFRAYDAATGKIIWADSTTARTYDTVNQVKGQTGGSLDGMGAAIANGAVYVISGFNGTANIGGNGVNVLLAYTVDGK